MTAPGIPSFTQPGINRQMLLARRPNGHPLPGDLALTEQRRPDIAPGKFLVRNLYLSADPVQRGWAAVQPLGTVMRALAVGVVVESAAPDFAPGDLVFGIFGWQDYCVPAPEDILSHVRAPRAPASAYAGVLGMPGVTAWLALRTIAQPTAGQRVLVSTAAGSVGSVAGQLIAHAGAVPVGLTGSAEKVERCLSRFGYAACANYKADDLGLFLEREGGPGFDTYFDNTGGWILDTAIRHMARYGRIIQCGTAATPSWNPAPSGLRNEREVLMRALTWTGFVIFDHRAIFSEAVEALTEVMLSKGLDHDEDIDSGFGKVSESLDEIFAGRHEGKKLVFIG
ncbi:MULTISPECIES: NADP-dependent oxidoreductase [unclassified Novosphingobium]|uniref:MDR family NADP-dependent oxidoreductase n=1 Tax=unclassified Novosphingobium TaxID=2644732 RepID=UPI0013590BB5|nr:MULTISPECIES: NADP-dependent oxidoreductase [unclassified Novosphingobium]